MPKILYGVSPIGLGHATRASAVGNSLADSGAEVEFFSGGRASDFLKGESFRVHDIVDDAGPEVRDGEMRGAALWYLRSWRAFKRTRKRTRRLLEERDPDLVVCDEEFSGVTVALETRRRNVFISDELELGFATTPLARVIERRVYSWYKNFQASAERVVVPDYGVDYGNVSHVGPMVRTVTKSKSEVSAEFALPPGNMVLFSVLLKALQERRYHKAAPFISPSRTFGPASSTTSWTMKPSPLMKSEAFPPE